ncbi:hypothetical protein A2U01_0049717 [Trifolium medium]|uniref:Uncharacterized protein n=1 Tax=Trifolium medium TaxID=97028 RepID=A0A392QYB5_9FABA|nr:hypothetical protein [Trifolium medium]
MPLLGTLYKITLRRHPYDHESPFDEDDDDDENASDFSA